MGRLVGATQVLGGHLGVELGGGDRGVPQQLLDHPDVGAAGQHVGGAGVAQHVGADPVGEPGAHGVAPQDAVGPLPAEPAAPGVEEHRLGVVAPAPLGGAMRSRPPGPSQAARPGRRNHPRDQPLLGALAQEADQLVAGREVGQVEADHLGDAGPGGVEELQQGAVAPGRGVSPVTVSSSSATSASLRALGRRCGAGRRPRPRWGRLGKRPRRPGSGAGPAGPTGPGPARRCRHRRCRSRSRWASTSSGPASRAERPRSARVDS